MALTQPGTKEWRDDAEAELIDLIRRHDEQNFEVTVRCDRGLWSVVATTLDTGRKATGEGASFADAWNDQVDPALRGNARG